MINVILFLAIGFLLGVAISIGLGRVQFIKDMFSESDKASFGRFGAFIALIASIGWVSWVVYNNKAIPDLGGVSLFIGTLYGLSKAGTVVQSFSNQGQDTGQK